MPDETVAEMFEKDSLLVELLATLNSRIQRLTEDWAKEEMTDRTMALELSKLSAELNIAIGMAAEKHLAWYNTRKALKDLLDSQGREKDA